MPHDARAIANALLDCAEVESVVITPLKLQKLIYFAHGHSWRTRRIGLVYNSFQAWDFGPVVRVVYDEFKELEDQQISKRAMWRNLAAGGLELAKAELSDGETKCIAQTVSIYGPVDAYTLSRLSHAPGGPWDSVRRDPKKYADGTIPKDLIEHYFINAFPGLHRQ